MSAEHSCIQESEPNFFLILLVFIVADIYFLFKS